MIISNVKIENLLLILKKYRTEKIIYVDVEIIAEENTLKITPVNTDANIEDTDEDLNNLIA